MLGPGHALRYSEEDVGDTSGSVREAPLDRENGSLVVSGTPVKIEDKPGNLVTYIYIYSFPGQTQGKRPYTPPC